jgi:hypothetical protein
MPRVHLHYNQIMSPEQAARIYHAQSTGHSALSPLDCELMVHLLVPARVCDSFGEWVQRNNISLVQDVVR